MKTTTLNRILAAAALLLAIAPQSGFACAACFGDPNSAMTKSANWFMGFFLGITWAVLSCLVAFMFYLRRKSREMEARLAEWEDAIDDDENALSPKKRFEWRDESLTIQPINPERRRANEHRGEKRGSPRRRFNFPE